MIATLFEIIIGGIYVSEKLYIARDQDGELFVYDFKPERSQGMWVVNVSKGTCSKLSTMLYDDLEWEDEPLEFQVVDSKEPKSLDDYLQNTLYNQHKAITQELHETYVAKNKDYGNSFGETYKELGNISTVMGRVTALTRILDKINRLKQLSLTDEVHVNDESLVDTIKDAANYLIMYAMELENEKGNE